MIYFAMSEDKLRYTVNYGLALHFKSILQKDVESSECFVVSLVENLILKSQEGQLDLVIPFFKENLGKVETRYWHSQFIGHSAANDVLEHFCKSLETLNNAKLRQVSMKGPSTNWKFTYLTNRSRADEQLPKLLSIRSCSLHILHGPFKTGSEKAG